MAVSGWTDVPTDMPTDVPDRHSERRPDTCAPPTDTCADRRPDGDNQTTAGHELGETRAPFMSPRTQTQHKASILGALHVQVLTRDITFGHKASILGDQPAETNYTDKYNRSLPEYAPRLRRPARGLRVTLYRNRNPAKSR